MMRFVSKLALSVMISALLVFIFGVEAHADNYNTYGDIVKLSGDIYVNEGDTADGNVVALNGDIYINGSVTGDVVAIFGDIIVNGKILGDAVSVTGRITVGKDGKVLGDTVEALGGMLTENNRSIIDSYVYRLPNIGIRSGGRAANAIISFFQAVALFILASIVYAIMPRRIEAMVDTIDSNLGRRMGIGTLTVIGCPIILIIISIMLAITLIGIFLIPFVLIAFMIFILVSIVPAYVFIGKRTVALFNGKKIGTFGYLAAGILVIWVVRAIISFEGTYTGFINLVISFLVSIIGAGTLVDYLYTIWKMRKSYK